MAANLARDLAEIAPPTQMRGLGDDDGADPDNDLRAMLTEQTPGRPVNQAANHVARHAHARHTLAVVGLQEHDRRSTHVEIVRTTSASR